ncbi:hypothetical protein [Porphyrobacter sp. AAP60]|uniref:hypothetical protein n=1 Tax=Porphyrobacter sp. AAP60 TaxID=1523423 RepID=UPI0006B9F6C4|nr:hypothetical protein [Porphyrobacter sp. AAP60]KPF65649.1 hypothetical protein IP79_00445 [Porphyrobacter sp. AAP60]
MPVFEGATNALYAVRDRFPDTWADDGIINIKVIRDGHSKAGESEFEPVIGFEIEDNGLGLNDELFDKFQELDTQHRAHLNGRGIGRLSWLKVFNDVTVSSTFERGGERFKRSFDFKLRDDNPFQNYIESSSIDELGTKIKMVGFKEKFGAKAYIDSVDIKRDIIAHFISIFAQPKRLKFNLVDHGKFENLSDFFFNSIVRDSGARDFEFESGIVTVRHVLVQRSIAPMDNSLVYCAAERSVLSRNLSEFLGMKFIQDDQEGALVYMGLVEGSVLDDALNHERTGFDFGDIDFEELNKLILVDVQDFLSIYLEDRRKKSRQLLDKVLQLNPLYSSAIGDPEVYAQSMPLNWDEKKLVEAVAVKRYRAQKALVKQIEKLDANTASMSDGEFGERVRKITSDLGESEKSALAQYVVERRMVISLLEKRRQFDRRKGEHESENLVHEVFCPLGVTSDVIDYNDHNLWLIDDRLAYYSFIASDRPISTYTGDVDAVDEDETVRRMELQEIGRYSERSEPDLAIIKRPMLFRRSKTPDPVVIIEFKAPGKTSYSGDRKDNPVIQIRKYIKTLQNKKAYDFEGNRISDIGDKTPFHCYLLAESCTQIYELLESHGIWKPTPDGNGRFGYLDDLNAYFEFVPYDQVLLNAKLRNEAFFKHLNIMDSLETAL